jgi:hypothetical protein
MRYMYLVLTSPEAAGPPPPRLMEQINKLADQAVGSGQMIANGGLTPITQAARVRVKGGKLMVTDGPFAETKEVVGGFAIFEFASREAALQSAIDFMELHRVYGDGWEGVCEMRPMVAMGQTEPACQP